MPVMVGVASDGNIKFILERNQRLHRVLRGRIHTDPAIPIECHEAERGVDQIIDQREIEPIAFGDRPPVMYSGATQRIDANADPGGADCLHVDNVRKIFDVLLQKVMPVGAGGRQSFLQREALDAIELRSQKIVGFASIQEVISPPPGRHGWGCI